MTSTRVIIPAILAMLAGGCATASSLPTAPSPEASGPQALTGEDLSGAWRLSSIRPAGQAEQPAPAGASYTLTFGNGRITTRADCNTCNGGFTLSGQVLTVATALACTRAACPTVAYETAYVQLLSGESTVAMSTGVLVVSSPRGELRFVR